MKKTNKNKVEEFIRVNHAGERGAIKIYEGQLLALNTLIKDENLKKKIEEMKVHEKEHCDYFESEIKKRNIEPSKFLPLWDILGVGLGFGCTVLGKKAAMLCTASVEEVIDKHYLDSFESNDSKPFWIFVIIQNGVNIDVNHMEIMKKYSFSFKNYNYYSIYWREFIK